MSTLTVKELSHPAGEVIKIAAGKTLDLNSQGTVTMPTGSVLQVVQALDTGNISSTSTSYADANLAATITPTSASSKILVLISQTGFTSNSQSPNFNIMRDATQVMQTYTQSQTTVQEFTGNFLNYLDSPATASAVTYKTQVKTNSGTVYLNWGGDGQSSITLMEIQG